MRRKGSRGYAVSVASVDPHFTAKAEMKDLAQPEASISTIKEARA